MAFPCVYFMAMYACACVRTILFFLSGLPFWCRTEGVYKYSILKESCNKFIFLSVFSATFCDVLGSCSFSFFSFERVFLLLW